MSSADREELQRRLAQVKRLVAEPVDALTMTRLKALAAEIQGQLAADEAAARPNDEK